MHLPTNLKIGGFDWTVEKNAHVSTEGSTFGSTHTNTQKIFLDPGTTDQKNAQTLLHEVIHAVTWQSGLSRRLEKFEDRKLEEEIVQSISMGLYQVLRDNKIDFYEDRAN